VSPGAYISRNEAATLSGVAPSVVNKAIEQKVVRVERASAGPLIDARDVGVLRIFGELRFGLPVGVKRHLAGWLREAEAGAELPLSASLVVRKDAALGELIDRALRYVQLRDRLVEVNPDRQGGEPVIRGTRISIRGLAKQIEAGEDDDVLRDEYDYLEPEAFEFAVLWARANPRRGRPARDAAPSTNAAPAGRAELLARRRQVPAG
jgi:uncharacterized protein (DUF433 family)